MFFQKTYAAAVGFAAVSNAHIYLASPKPFEGTISSPLDESGSNFPCQGLSPGAATSMSLGSTQKLAFIGSAVHGGGSCQVSITYDTNPTKDSVWKVLHSIEGGCPVAGQAGNMGDNAAAVIPPTYSYQIPSDIPGGNATIAWTWLNRIGNREFYMNCAAVNLEGGGGDKSSLDSLPDMVVANIPSINSCSTTGLDGKDYLYPNPGSSVEKHPFQDGDLVELNGDCGAAASGGSSSGDGSSSGGSSSGSGSSSSDAPATTSQAAASTGLPGGVFITAPAGGSDSSSSAPTPTAVVESPSATPTSAPAPSATSGSDGSSGGSDGSSSSGAGAQAAGSACSPEGLWNCVDGSSYQQCGSGTWSPVMALATGTKCTGGQGPNINIFAANGKKARRVSMRFRA